MNDVYYEYEINGEKDYIFFPAKALSILLAKEVVELSTYWWKNEWPEKAREGIYLGINCSCVFYEFVYGPDEETVKMGEIEDLYTEWLKHDIWGPIVFCIKKRKQRPLEDVFNQIQELGIWDLNSFDYE